MRLITVPEAIERLYKYSDSAIAAPLVGVVILAQLDSMLEATTQNLLIVV